MNDLGLELEKIQDGMMIHMMIQTLEMIQDIDTSLEIVQNFGDLLPRHFKSVAVL